MLFSVSTFNSLCYTMHGRWSTIHRLKHDIQTPYHDTRYTIHTPNEHELNTHRIMVPGLENDQSASGARSSATASTRAGPVRAEASPPSAYGTSSNQCMSLLLSCFFTFCVLRFAFCFLWFPHPPLLTPCFVLRASCFVLRFSCLFISYEISPRTNKQTNQTDFPSSPLPFPSLHKSHRDKYVARAEWDDLAGRHRALEERVGRMERVLYALHPELLAPPGVQSSMPMSGLGLGAGIGMGMGLGLGDREGDRERERERDRERRRTVQSPSVGLGGLGLGGVGGVGGMGVGLAGPGTMGTSTDRDRIDRIDRRQPIPSSSYPAPPALSNQHPPAHQRRASASASALALALHSPRTGMHFHSAQSQSQSHRDRDRDRSRSRSRPRTAGAPASARPGSSGAGAGFATGEGSGMRGVYIFYSFSFSSVQLSFTILFSSLLYLLSFTLLDSTLYSLFGTPCFIHFDVFFFMIQNLSNDYTNRLLYKPTAQPQASNTRSPPTTMTTTNKSPTWRPDGRS